MKDVLLDLLEKTDFYAVYMGYVRPYIKNLVDDPEAKWDDALLGCLDALVEAFLKKEEAPKEVA